ncbi:chemotaxis protein CheB [Beggiatoa alba]|nr:chemotaxis protein CheB [Beggiatoa alba]
MKKHNGSRYQAVVIGSSAGGIKALSAILKTLPSTFPLPILIVQHLHPDSDSYIVNILSNCTSLRVKQADEKEGIMGGVIYIAPPNYHLLVEEDKTLSLSIDAPVNFSRPSVDVLFETAAYAYREGLIGVILTGANSDGSQGVKKIKKLGGCVIVQSLETAEAKAMPQAAINAIKVDKVLPIEQIGTHLSYLANR